MHCPNCGSDAFCKNGMAGKKQRYRCKSCGCQFTQSHKRGYPPRMRELAVLLYVYGLSMNAIARLLGISHQTSYRWIRDKAESLPPQPQVHHKVTEAEIDEMCFYLKKSAKECGSGRCITVDLNSSSAGISGLVIRLL